MVGFGNILQRLYDGEPRRLFEKLEALELEGMVMKRKDGVYAFLGQGTSGGFSPVQTEGRGFKKTSTEKFAWRLLIAAGKSSRPHRKLGLKR